MSFAKPGVMAAELKPEVAPAVSADQAPKQVKRNVSFSDEQRPSSTPSVFPSDGNKKIKRNDYQVRRPVGRDYHPAGRSLSASPRGILGNRTRTVDFQFDTAWLEASTSGNCNEDAMSVPSVAKENQIPAGILFRHLLGTSLESSLANSPGSTGSSVRKHSYTVMGTKSLKASALHPINVSFFLAQQEEIAAWTPADMSPKARLDRRQSYPAIGIPVPDGLLHEEKVNQRKARQVDGSLTPRGDESRPRRSKKLEYQTRLMAERKRETPFLGPKHSMPRRWDVADAFHSTLDSHVGIDGVKLPAVASCLSYTQDGSYAWHSCVVLGFDASTSLYLVFWREKEEFRQDLPLSSESGMHDEALSRLVGQQNREGTDSRCPEGNSSDISTSTDGISSGRSGVEVAFHRLVPRLNLRFQDQVC